MAKATTTTDGKGTGKGIIVTDVTEEPTARKAKAPASARSRYLQERAERARKREQKETDKLIARIALAADPRLLAKAKMAGYASRLDDRPVTDEPYAGRLESFSAQWIAGWKLCDAELAGFDTAR